MIQNGAVPDGLLRTIDGHGTRLRDWCADVWARMVADARADGVTLTPSYTPPPAPAGLAGYRDYATQKWLYYHPTGPVPIAPPGSSTHGLGERLDVSADLDWIVAHMSKYGVRREFDSEPWHFAFGTTLASLGLTPITATKRRNTMTTMYVKTSSSPDREGKAGSLWALAGDVGYPCAGNWREFTRTPADGSINDKGARFAAIHGNAVMLTDAEWADYKTGYTTPPQPVASVPGPVTIELTGTVKPASN